MLDSSVAKQHAPYPLVYFMERRTENHDSKAHNGTKLREALISNELSGNEIMSLLKAADCYGR